MQRNILFLLGGAGVALAMWMAFRPEAVPVEVGRVTRGPLVVSVLEEGQTRVRNRFVISPPIPGLLRRTALREGDSVIAGETVVMSLETRPSTFLDPRSREQAEAAVMVAESALRLREAEVGRAEAQVTFVLKAHERVTALLRDGVAAQQEWDRAEAERVVRERDLAAAA